MYKRKSLKNTTILKMLYELIMKYVKIEELRRDGRSYILNFMQQKIDTTEMKWTCRKEKFKIYEWQWEITTFEINLPSGLILRVYTRKNINFTSNNKKNDQFIFPFFFQKAIVFNKELILSW